MATVTEKILSETPSDDPHRAGTLTYRTLAAIEELLGDSVERTAETGCGRSTILFSCRSREHHVFCLDDREHEGSSVGYFRESSTTRQDVLKIHFGPTQQTLPAFEHPGEYDCVLIDGPHGFPFPELEYYFFYPHIREGGFLIVDDVQIPTIGRMADVIQEDIMWEFVSLTDQTAVFRRTGAKGIPADGDHWWTQRFNRRRVRGGQYRLDDGGELPSFAQRIAERDAQRPLPLRRKIKKTLRLWRRGI